MTEGRDRLSLGKGEWADLKTRVTHGDAARIRAAIYATFPRQLPGATTLAEQQAFGEAEVVLLQTYARVFVTDWHLTDDDGNLLPFEPESWNRLPEHKFARLSRRAQELWLAYWKAHNDPLVEPLESGAPGSTSSPTDTPPA